MHAQVPILTGPQCHESWLELGHVDATSVCCCQRRTHLNAKIYDAEPCYLGATAQSPLFDAILFHLFVVSLLLFRGGSRGFPPPPCLLKLPSLAPVWLCGTPNAEPKSFTVSLAFSICSLLVHKVPSNAQEAMNRDLVNWWHQTISGVLVNTLDSVCRIRLSIICHSIIT